MLSSEVVQVELRRKVVCYVARFMTCIKFFYILTYCSSIRGLNLTQSIHIFLTGKRPYSVTETVKTCFVIFFLNMHDSKHFDAGCLNVLGSLQLACIESKFHKELDPGNFTDEPPPLPDNFPSFPAYDPTELTAYTDAAYGHDPRKRRSTTGFDICLAGGTVVFRSKIQKVTTLAAVLTAKVVLFL